MDIKKTLKLLCESSGVAGSESAASEAALELLKKYIPDAETDSFNNVIGVKKHGEDLPMLLLDAHIDEIGMVVNFIDEKGFLRVSRSGGIDRRALPAQRVIVHGKKPLKGVICALPPHVQKDENKTIKEDEIAVDCGYSKEEIEQLISLGDVVTFDEKFTEMQCGKVTAKALDNRAGVTAVLFALELLEKKKPLYNIAVIFSSQEELGCRGAGIAAYKINPDLAIAVDVSYGNYPGCSENKTGKLSSGVMIGTAPVLDKALFMQMKKIAEKEKIPYQIEVMGGKTGTNADVISLVKNGVKSAILSIPLRNMHTPAELADIADIEAVGRLISEFVAGGNDE